MKGAVPLLIVVLALAGIADSAYLTLSHYQAVKSVEPLAGAACSLDAGGCESLSQSPQATLFGVPYALMGAAYYALVLGLVYVKLQTGDWPLPSVLWLVFLGAIAFSGYLLYVLLFQLNMPCPFCLAAHAINLLIVALYAISRVAERPRGTNHGRWALGAR